MTCEMDFNVGDPVISSWAPQPLDAGGGNGDGGGNGGLTAGYADVIDLAVTEIWVGQNLSYDGQCIYGQNAWPGSWQFTATGWSSLGYQFSSGMSNLCPQCPQHPGYMTTLASVTNATFLNAQFCYHLTGVGGSVTFTDYAYVSDYGFGDGSTVWTFSSTATGGCSVLLHSFYTFT